MTWLKHPGKLRFLTFSISDLWVGQGTDTGKFAYQTAIGGATKYVVTDGFVGFKLKVGDTVLEPVFSDVNGAFYFQGGNFILHRTASNNWVLMESELWRNDPIPPGYRPVSWYNSETQQTEGDAWWSGSLPNRESVVFYSEGTAEGTKTVEFYMPRWEKTLNAYGSASSLTYNVLGTYTDPEGVQDDLTVGVREWKDSTGKRYEKSLETVNWSYVYGTIHRGATNEPWVIGVYKSPDGWMEGEEPSVENPVTFSFETNAVSDLHATVYELFGHGYEREYSPVYHDSATQTFRISTPDVTTSVGWLECTEATFRQTLTFTKADETLTYTISELLKGTVAGLEARDGALHLGDWECTDAKLTETVTFTYTHINKDDLTVSYYRLILSDNKARNVVVGEVAIWR